MAFKNFHHITLLWHILIDLGIDNLATGFAVVECLLHHTATHGGHLRTMLGVHDGGNDVAAECGTNLIKQVLIVLSGLGIVVVANLQLSTVGGEATGER